MARRKPEKKSTKDRDSIASSFWPALQKIVYFLQGILRNGRAGIPAIQNLQRAQTAARPVQILVGRTYQLGNGDLSPVGQLLEMTPLRIRNQHMQSLQLLFIFLVFRFRDHGPRLLPSHSRKRTIRNPISTPIRRLISLLPGPPGRPFTL